MSTFIWKPSGVATWKGGPLFLAPEGSSGTPTIKGPDGKTYTGKYINTNEGRRQWVFPKELVGMQGLEVSYGGTTATIENGAQSYEGSSLSGMQARAKGSLGSAGGMGGAGGFSPTQIGQYAFAPAYLGGMFPQATLAQFNPIQAAPYKYTDPFKFAGKYGQAARDEITKNYKQAKELGLDQVQTELQGLKDFVPGASALKRDTLAQDNIFNQEQRTKQVDTTLPEVRAQLMNQGQRADTFAKGKLTSDIEDRAFEVGVRSKAADIGNAGGFGASSSVSRKTSDLMSAEQRLNLSKYGDQLLTNNIGTKANLYLAPTAYSDAGQQVRVTPSVDAGSRVAQNFSQINQLASLPTSQAFNSEIGQQQFSTNLEQGTRTFNAQNQFQASQFNAQAQNQFALDLFGYQAGYAGALAGASQTNLNTGFALQQQQQAQDVFNQGRGNAQSNQTAGAVGSIIGGLAPSVINAVGDYLDSPSSSGSTSGGGLNLSPTTGLIDSTSGVVSPDGYSSGGGLASSGSSTGGGLASNAVSTEAVTSAPIQSVPVTAEANIDQTSSFVKQLKTSQLSASNVKSIVENTPEIDNSHIEDLHDFLKTTNTTLDVEPGKEVDVLKALTKSSDALLGFAGISKTPQQGTIKIGYNGAGKPVYADPKLSFSTDVEVGSKTINEVKDMLHPFEMFTPEDSIKFGNLANKSSDLEFIKTLDAHHDSKQFSSFLSSLNSYLQGA